MKAIRPTKKPTAKQRLIKIRAELRQLHRDYFKQFWGGDGDRILDAAAAVQNVLDNYHTPEPRQ
jgi:hypothetical protein